MTLNQDIITTIGNITTKIKKMVSDHAAIKGDSSTFGHVQSGDSSSIKPIGNDLSVGTDNHKYARADHIHTVSYTNVKNTPYIPEKTSDLINDGEGVANKPFLTEHQDISGKVNIAQGSEKANLNVVTNASGNITTEAKPTIPSKTSQLTNDSGFITQHQDISEKEDKANKTSSWNSTTNNTRYPTEKLVKDSLDGKASSTHTHGNISNTGTISNAPSKNVVTDSNGKIITEDKYTHPSTHATTIIKEETKLDNIGTNANDTQHTVNTKIDEKLGNVITYDVVEDTLDDDSAYPIQNGTVSKALKTKANGTELTALANNLDTSILNLTNQLTSAGSDIDSIELELSNVVKKTDIQENYTDSPGMPVKASVIKQDLDSKVPISDGATKVYDYNARNYNSINPTMESGNFATQQNINSSINSKFSSMANVATTGDYNDLLNIPTYPHITIGFTDDDFNLYLGDTTQNGFDICADKNIIQKNENITLVGLSNQGSILYFYEVYKPLFCLSSNKIIIQNQEEIILSTVLKDEIDGNRISGQKIYFYEVYTPTISIFSNKNIIQKDQQADITAKIKDTDGNLIKNQEIYFYETYIPTLKTTSNKNIIQTNEQSDITAKLQDTDGNVIPNTEVYFYKKT